MTQSVWRKWKREHKKFRQKEWAEQEANGDRALAEYNARQKALRDADGLGVRLWGAGNTTKENPSGRMGIVTHFLLLVVGVPLLGLLYGLSFTWYGCLVFMGIVYVYLKYRKRNL